MRTGHWSVSGAFVIGVSALLTIAPWGATASPPVTGSGWYTVTGAAVTGVRLADGNVFLTETEYAGAAGTLPGTFPDTIEGQGSVVSADLHGTITILRGSGDLEGLPGHMTIEGIPATGGTYAVQLP